MPIPFLIAGGLLAAAVTAYALSDDDKPSSSGSSNGRGEAERRRKETAKKERIERERTQKLEAAHADFQKQGRAFGKDLVQAMPSELVEACLRRSFTLDFDLNKRSFKFDLEEASQRDADFLATIDDLEVIFTKRASHQKIIENLAIFSELYKPDFQHQLALRAKKKRVLSIDEGIEKLKQAKVQLMKLESDAAST